MKNALPILPALAVALLALWSLAFYATLPARLPTDADYRAAAAHLRPGDELVVHPGWAERARLFARGLAVHASPELARGPRVWLLALTRAPGAGEPPALPGRRTEGPFRHGALTIELYEQVPEQRPLYDFVAHVPDAEVSVGDRPCARERGGAFRCNPPPLARVAREEREVGYLPRDCIFAHPQAEGPVRIVFPQAPLGAAVEGGGGIAHEGAFADPEPGPVELVARVDGAVVGAAAFPGRGAWRPFRFPVPSGGREGRVEFEVRARNIAWRLFCFEARSVP